MTHRTLIAAGAAALAGLGVAGSALAAPVIDGVEVTRTGAQTLQVDVGTERGSDSARPRIAVTSNVVRVNRGGDTRRASLRVPAIIELGDWRGAAKAGAPVTATATLERVKQGVGTTIPVRVRACDSDGCITVNRRAKVRDGSGRSSRSTAAATRSADEAVKAALRAAGAGSTLISVEREDDDGAAWEVKVRRADGATVEVYVSATGTVLGTEVKDDDDDRDDDRRPLPAGSVGSSRAVAVALAHVGSSSSLVRVEREDDRDVAWEVKVRAGNGAMWEVEVSPSGKVVKAEIDD